MPPAALELLKALAAILGRWGRWYLEDEFFARAKTMDIGGAGVPVIDITDLLIAKVLAGRPKDIEDARGLWRLRRSDIDRRRIRRVLRLLEEALGQSDLVSGFDAIATKHEHD